MKLVIAGSRDFEDYERMCAFLEKMPWLSKVTAVISGRARGADRLGERWAKDKGIEVIARPADWDKHGKAAGHIRNAEMAKEGDLLVAFWDGVSRGTKNMINTMSKLGKDYYVCRTDFPADSDSDGNGEIGVSG